ncbi:MAG TPA: biopolymer transporter ExbD [Thermoanaerobaculia bacterium]|nr:biopolymer transporter ExbD [Thermoanaerobaculia bacterium]
MALAPKGKIDGAEDVRSDINVTPLVDVMLVLLIIFMVVTPLLQKGIDVNLPLTADPPKMPESPRQLDVAIKRDGSIYIAQTRVAKEAVLTELRRYAEQNSERDVVLKADKTLPYKQVRELMKLINEAGFADVGLVTQKKQSG